MCGFLFLKKKSPSTIRRASFETSLIDQEWQGPDAQETMALEEGRILIGHNRLAVIDPIARSDQPMRSRCGNYWIRFNGEIYNHLDIRKKLQLVCETNSDTETILEAFARIGDSAVNLLEGMFAFVIYSTRSGEWIAARDSFGIKPLYYYQGKTVTIYGSEPAVISQLMDCKVDSDSMQEWHLTRRPVPGKSYFRDIFEHTPAIHCTASDGTTKYWHLRETETEFCQNEFESLVCESVLNHELSDVTNVSLLSGGLDSAVITGLSHVRNSYSIGLINSNEIRGTEDSAQTLNRELVSVLVSEEELTET